MLARSAGASMLICSGVIERTLINMACKTYITFLFNDAIGKVIPFDLQASFGNVGVILRRPVLELAAPQGVAAGEGIPGFGGSDVWMGRDAEEGILGIVAVAAVV